MSRSSHHNSDTVRSCVVCRSSRHPRELLRLGELAGAVAVGRPANGRSAYVCVARSCLDRLGSSALSRALRKTVTLDAERFLDDLHCLAERRVLEMVGLARRQGGLVCGVDDVVRGQGVVLLANDLSSRGRRDVREKGREFVDGATLGRAAGMGWVGAARIDVTALAEQAGYWLALWYESRSTAVDDSTQGLSDQAAPTGI